RILSGAYEHLTEDGILIVEVGNSVAQFGTAFPHLAVTWIDFENGGDGVFVIARKQLTGVAGSSISPVAKSEE
ncbi:MAG: 50S ribosomal protein L3 N(5)-glutamine methyltransferase, partial [Gammaproteobacteria bacterium]|nr:50S ribosomal protein L3 N(5)-glutamine methyltransferase [Gammaproteobacteria bacterium]